MRTYRYLLRLALAGFVPMIAALQFLTRLPLPMRFPDSDAVFRRSTVFYPAAGLLIGLLTAGSAWGFSYLFPFYINAALVLILWVFLSGGLHLDGLMDTADGLLSHRSRERMLEIMKDSRVGAMGVMACVLYLLLKMTLLAGFFAGMDTGGTDLGWQDRGSGFTDNDLLAGHADGAMTDMHTQAERLSLFVLIPLWSRALLPTAIALWPYARPGGSGLGRLFRTVRGRHAAAAFGLAAALTLPVLRNLGGFGWLESLLWCAVLAAATCLVGGIGAALVTRKLGGLTGDVYGALNELIELALLLGLVAYEFWLGSHIPCIAAL